MKTRASSEKTRQKTYNFGLQQLLVVGLAIPMLAIAACHRTTTTADSSVTFGKVVMAANVDANNAPTALADTFSPSQKVVYMVAEAKSVAPGTKLAASWTREGTPVQVSNDLIATQGYHNTNIEFHLNAGADGLVPGNYKAQLIVNGEPGPSASFTVK